jgi:type VI secretion system secreted protein Hcp
MNWLLSQARVSRARRLALWCGLAIVYALPLFTIYGAIDMFLKIDGIEGESTDSKHKYEIDVTSWSFGLTQSVSHVGGGGGAGQAEFRDLQIVKLMDKSSPKLFLASASGEHLQKAVLTMRKSGDNPVDFVKVTLTDVIVSSFNSDLATNGQPIEEITLNYGKLEFQYVPVDAKGISSTPIKVGWDLKLNKAN